MESARSGEQLHLEEVDVEHDEVRAIVSAIVRAIVDGLLIGVEGKTRVFYLFVVLVGQAEPEASHILVV